MMHPLVEYYAETEMEDALDDIQQTIQKLFGSYKGYIIFIDNHFELPDNIKTKYTKGLGIE